MNVLLDEALRLGEADSKTNICIPMPLERDYQSLEILCSYTPKLCEDERRARRLIAEGIKAYIPPEYREQFGPGEGFIPSVVNLITLSLDWEGEYIGCAHRHAPDQRHIISADFSSPGFFRYPPRAGNWRAVINVHAVVSAEVRYHLRILGHEEGVR